MESGRLHLRVNQDKDFKLKLAKCMIAESHPGYHGDGWHYVDVVGGVIYYVGRQDFYRPWHNSDDFKIVELREVFVEENNYSPCVDWELTTLPKQVYQEMARAYIQTEMGGVIPQQIKAAEVIGFARNCQQWSALIEKIEKDTQEEAIQFAMREIKDEVITTALIST
jgi:hypothetical protein